MYVIILNFEMGIVDCISLKDKPETMEPEEYIEQIPYSLTDCQWMVTDEPFIRPVNF
jgi:hypothetical protein